MENKKNNKGIIILLISIIVILLTLCVLFVTGTISIKLDKSNNIQSGENANKDNNVIETLIDSVKITNLSIDKPYASAFGGEKINQLSIKTNFNLDCSNDAGIAGITLKGYCLDKNDNKYSIVGPLSVMAFYCDNDSNHTDSGKDTGAMYVDKTYDENGVPHDIDWANSTNIKWEGIDIKYCKIEKANIRLKDGSEINTAIELNYEKEFK